LSLAKHLAGDFMFHLLHTERLLLRPPRAGDIRFFVPLLNDFGVSKNLSRVPHPYTEDDACAYIVDSTDRWLRGEDHVFAVQRKEDGAFIGMCGVHPGRGWEFGYWLGRPFWGAGFATEAAAALIAFAFDTLGAERLRASWFHDNPASGRVLAKLGCAPDGEEMHDCLSRGGAVFCHKVVLTRQTHARKVRMQ
jgi:RimJ/RimL family protein N-acetyltransferase